MTPLDTEFTVKPEWTGKPMAGFIHPRDEWIEVPRADAVKAICSLGLIPFGYVPAGKCIGFKRGAEDWTHYQFGPWTLMATVPERAMTSALTLIYMSHEDDWHMFKTMLAGF